ncbi:MAG: tetratricopeptide repeat protein [Acidobacteriota bacterium]|nr:tetratricopeptide repeat protein [Acidobacteriota bacterium]
MRKALVLFSVVVLALSGVGGMSCSRGHRWTSSSPEAVREFELGLDSRMKLYGHEANEHFERALELDPNFVAAKHVLARHGEGEERREQLIEELRSVDLDRLTERERFLVQYTLARRDGRSEDAAAILAEFLDDQPRDAFGVATQAEEAWTRQDWEAASEAYERLLEIDPNWVTAQNHLGYMMMAQGRFDDAEDRFETYRFVAPDQANPHDSMGELLTVVGRYEEALAELEEAVAIRPDFCASYLHMLDVLVLEGRPYDGYQVLERAEENCSDQWTERIGIERCELAFWSDYLEGDFDAPWRKERQACLKEVGPTSFLIHRIASLSARWEVATAIENELTEYLENAEKVSDPEAKTTRGVLGHFQGVRLLAQGDIEEAIAKMRDADAGLSYWGQNQGILKLFNRLNLASALERAGRDAEAASVLEEVRKVNAPFAEAYPDIKAGFSS